LLFTSLGPLVLHGGTEIMRSKGAAPLEEIVKETASGKLEYHGKRDTYNLRVANQFVWENVGKTSANAPNDYANMLAYWKGLMALRNSDIGQVFRVGTAPPDGYYQWFLPDDAHLLGYLVDNRVLVLINTSDTAQAFENVTLPEGDWQLIANADEVDPANGLAGDGALLEGGNTYTLSVPAVSLKIWTRN
jgi:hypothetical protein